MGKAILDYISDSLTEGGFLPDDFSLPEVQSENHVKFADGAMDGILIYHSAFSVIEEAEKAEILDALKLAEKGEFDNAAGKFSEFCKSHRAIGLIDDIQGVIMDHTDELSVQQMVRFAIGLITGSDDRELIKIGLIILELVNTANDPNLMRHIRTLGLSDEFTLFSVFIMRHWPDGQMEILDLARRVHGWGRIHCVQFIEPENDEIRHWLLTDGIDNGVMSEYSALTVFEKTGIEEMLDRSDLSEEEVKSILNVIDSMLVEGSVTGISGVEDPPEVLAKVLKAAGKIAPDENEQRILNDVKELYERMTS